MNWRLKPAVPWPDDGSIFDAHLKENDVESIGAIMLASAGILPAAICAVVHLVDPVLRT